MTTLSSSSSSSSLSIAIPDKYKLIFLFSSLLFCLSTLFHSPSLRLGRSDTISNTISIPIPPIQTNPFCHRIQSEVTKNKKDCKKKNNGNNEKKKNDENNNNNDENETMDIEHGNNNKEEVDCDGLMEDLRDCQSAVISAYHKMNMGSCLKEMYYLRICQLDWCGDDNDDDDDVNNVDNDDDKNRNSQRKDMNGKDDGGGGEEGNADKTKSHQKKSNKKCNDKCGDKEREFKSCEKRIVRKEFVRYGIEDLLSSS